MTTININKDSYIYQYSPDLNYGSENNMFVQGSPASIQRSLLGFDITSIEMGSVLSATLYIYAAIHPSHPDTIVLERITGTWTETGVTWNNQPTVTSTNSTTEYISGLEKWYAITITDMFKDETGNDFSIMLKSNNEGFTTWQISILTKEFSTAFDAYIVIEYGDKYVDISTGSDSDNGASWINAYQTVKKGIDNVAVGKKIHIAKGDYSAQAVITLDKNLELVCEDYGGGNASPPLTVVLPPTV